MLHPPADLGAPQIAPFPGAVAAKVRGTHPRTGVPPYISLQRMPTSDGPAYLGVMNHLDLKQAVALAVDRCRVVLYQPEAKYDPFPAQVAEALDLGKKAFSVRKPVRE